jgi:hypothetical protein
LDLMNDDFTHGNVVICADVFEQTFEV